MEILKGLLYINGIDAYEEYGAFLSEENEGDNSNYNTLLKPAAAKAHTPVDIREHDGEKYPDELKPALKARDLELRFTIEAKDMADFFQKYRAFAKAVTKGDKGWVTMTLTDIGRSYRMFYKDCSDWTQLTDFQDKVYSSCVMIFREPDPEY